MVKKHTGERTQSPLSPRPVLPLPSKLSEEGGVFVFDPGGGLGQSIKLVRRPCRSSWEGKGVATSGKPPPWHGNLLMDELRGAIPSREDFRVMRVSHHLVLGPGAGEGREWAAKFKGGKFKAPMAGKLLKFRVCAVRAGKGNVRKWRSCRSGSGHCQGLRVRKLQAGPTWAAKQGIWRSDWENPGVGSKWAARVSARPEAGAELLSGAGRGGTHLGGACQRREEQHGQRQAGQAEPRAQPQQAAGPQACHRGSQPPQRARAPLPAGDPARDPPPALPPGPARHRPRRVSCEKASAPETVPGAPGCGAVWGLPRPGPASPAAPGGRPRGPRPAGRVSPIPGNCRDGAARGALAGSGRAPGARKPPGGRGSELGS